MRARLVLLSVLLAACGRSSQNAPAPVASATAAPVTPASTTGDAPKAGKLAWTDPPGWQKNPPKNAMRQGEYVIPKSGGDTEDAECVVTTFGPGQGGTIEMNLDRWIRQFSADDGTKLEKNEERVAGMRVSEVTLSGTYRGMGMTGQQQDAKQHQRMLGAIVDSPSGLWFFKVTGPDATVKAAEPAFHALIRSIH